MVQSGSRSWRAFYRYQYVRRLLAEFIKQRYNRSDIALKEIQPAFITDFEFFFAHRKKHGNTTIWMYMMPLRKMISTAINNGWLSRDPFYGYSIAPEVTDRGYLTKDEIRTLMEYSGGGTKRGANRELVRDMFIFCGFTDVALTQNALTVN